MYISEERAKIKRTRKAFRKKLSGMNIPIEIKPSLHFIVEKMPNKIIKVLNTKPDDSFDNSKTNFGIQTKKVLL